MHLHHILPPPHILGFVLTAGLAFAAGAILMTRGRVATRAALAGAQLKRRASAWRERNSNCDGRFSAVFAKSNTHRSDNWNSTGNAAFEEYRSATLTGLEQEAAAFRKYLDELRHAKDKSEFDAFLSERRRTAADETSSP